MAYEMLLDLHNSGFSTWIKKIYEILCKCNLEHEFTNTHFSHSDIHRITSSVKSCLETQYKTLWKNEVQDKPKLRTYKLFKNTFFIEPYLFLYNKNHRQALARFRMSSHSLEIEKGCWRRIQVNLVNGKWQLKAQRFQ